MNWLGQHIWGLITRFRNTIIIETIETGTSDKVLVRESDGVVKEKDCKCAKGDEVREVRGDDPIQVDNTDAEKPVVSIDAASGDTRGTMASGDYTKLDGIETGATRNVGEVKEVKGTAPVAVDDTDPEKPVVSIAESRDGSAGLMSGSDKTKLDGIATGADVTPSWVPADDPGYGSGTVKTLTTTGTSGKATLSRGTLNIPEYAGGGSTEGADGKINVIRSIDKGVAYFYELEIEKGLIKTITEVKDGADLGLVEKAKE